MENFQYSVQLSDQDWAEFSAAAEECGLLHAGLASGDEVLSSDTDQRDSSGSSPPGPPPLLEGQLAPRGSGWPGLEEEDKAATRQLVSRSWHEPVLALGAGEQTPSTSTRSEAWLPLGSGAAPPVQSASLPVSSRDEMQRLMQEPAPRGTAPTSTVEPPRSSESPGRSAVPQRPHGSPGAPPRSPSRKKRRAAGGKGSGPSSSPGSALPPLGGPLLTEARPEEGLSPAGTRGKGLPAGMVEQTAGARQIKLRPESAGAPEQAGPDMVEAEVAPVAQLVLNPVQSPRGHQEKLGEEPSAGGPGPRSCFAVTLPEAYEFFLCDTIHEEDEDAEGAAEACPAPADVQWPEVCEFFFQDCRKEPVSWVLAPLDAT
ncbi:hypothetical protein CB1_000203025 [Camelus ferus]|nr:hypothetical protein CB1_000203025 [Camelus ferus]